MHKVPSSGVRGKAKKGVGLAPREAPQDSGSPPEPWDGGVQLAVWMKKRAQLPVPGEQSPELLSVRQPRPFG